MGVGVRESPKAAVSVLLLPHPVQSRICLKPGVEE